MDSADLHCELCNEVVLRLRAETWAQWNFNSAADDSHGLGEWSSGKIGKHGSGENSSFAPGYAPPLEKPVPDKRRWARGWPPPTRPQLLHGGNAQLDHGGLNVISLADGDHSVELAQTGCVLADPTGNRIAIVNKAGQAKATK